MAHGPWEEGCGFRGAVEMSPILIRVGCAFATVLSRRPVTSTMTWGAGPATDRGKPVWQFYEPAVRAGIVTMLNADGNLSERRPAYIAACEQTDCCGRGFDATQAGQCAACADMGDAVLRAYFEAVLA